MTQALADMRRSYTRDGLDEAQAPSEPFSLFRQWFGDAVNTEQAPVEANAMTLATVDADGRPHCRVLLLKGLDEQGFTFFSNYDSAKGQQLAQRPFAAMTFFLAYPRAAGPHRGEGEQGECGRVRRLLPGPPTGQSPGCLGVAAEPSHCRSWRTASVA